MLQHCCCYATGLFSHTDVEKVINMPVTACRGRSTHACMQAGNPRLIHYQQLELPPCIHQKEGCGAIENSTLPQCPCWTDWEIQEKHFFRVRSHMANVVCRGETWKVQNGNKKEISVLVCKEVNYKKSKSVVQYHFL